MPLNVTRCGQNTWAAFRNKKGHRSLGIDNTLRVFAFEQFIGHRLHWIQHRRRWSYGDATAYELLITVYLLPVLALGKLNSEPR